MAKILIIDDDPDFTDSSRTILESQGHATNSAPNTREGWDQVRSYKPDLIILDVMMEQPDDGIAMAQDLRRKGVKTPILLLTGISKLAGMEFGPDAEMVPVDAYLEKPAEPAVLLAKVAELLKGKTR